jgi:hypothetical protein
MENGFLTNLEKLVGKETIFTDVDLSILLPNLSQDKLYNALRYHLKRGHLKKYKRGVYLLSPSSREKSGISKFCLSNFLYNPSFISFESALSYYGLIPEAVYETTAACSQHKNKIFKTSDSLFTFSHSPVIPFFLDVVKKEKEAFVIANPLRALFDVMYSTGKQYHRTEELEDDLRVDLEELNRCLKEYEASDILHLGELYRKKNTKKFSTLLIKEFK